MELSGKVLFTVVLLSQLITSLLRFVIMSCYIQHKYLYRGMILYIVYNRFDLKENFLKQRKFECYSQFFLNVDLFIEWRLSF